ncbi:hypothetical protein Z046_31100 [Pseudomonas aeruginosa VRFPA09]|nr:hypothetical protein Z046_31100 [Pseudomonas aeruginosa VRFPA09]
MQGTLQGIGDRLRQFAGAVGEEADQGLDSKNSQPLTTSV